MELEVLRYSSGEETTLGLLSDVSAGKSEFLCYTLEDEYRTTKVMGDTRIPAGEYEITLRTVGGKSAKYGARYPDIHKGMLWLRNVPGFQYILIHVGNTDEDTEGCILVGNNVANNITGSGFIGESANAYKRIYPLIANRLAAGETVTISIVDKG